MLSELRIVNLAVIEDVTVAFGPGLNALTGETGAGKSLLVEAIDLVLGARAAPERVRRGAREAEITARFDVDAGSIQAPGGESSEAEDGSFILRRVLGADGRSRAYVNDRPSTLGRLRELGRALADLHGQHEQQNLLSEDTHLDYLDAVAGCGEAFGNTASAYARAASAREARDAFAASLRRAAEERDLLRFQWEELRGAELREGEEEELRSERHVAAHAGRLAEAAAGSVEALAEGDPGAVSLLGKASRLLGQAAALDSSLEAIRRQVDEALVAVEDAARELREYAEQLDSDPERLDAIESRLDLLARLKRKYHGDVQDLIERRDKVGALLEGMEDASGRMAALDREVEEADAGLAEAAGALSALRSRGAASFARQVTRELQGLGMSGARFRVELRAPHQGISLPGLDRPVGPRGAEEAVFLLAANPGEAEGPLVRIASGGELSRVMLALKNVLRRVDPVPVAIFDEIDSGIGGLVAEAVADRLAKVAEERQVLVVTHLAMVAGKAAHHLRLVKSTRRDRTSITVEAIDGKTREEELARMMAGRAGGEAARRTARALLEGETR